MVCAPLPLFEFRYFIIPFTWTNPGWIWISVNLDSTRIECLHGTFHEQLLVWFINSVSWLRNNATQTVTSAQWLEAAWSSCCQQHCSWLFVTLQDSVWSVGKDYWVFSTNVQCLKEKDSTDSRYGFAGLSAYDEWAPEILLCFAYFVSGVPTSKVLILLSLWPTASAVCHAWH